MTASPGAPAPHVTGAPAPRITRGRAPLVSVLVPAYRAAEWIEAAVGSALAQTVDDIEVLVFDDASPDDTQARLARIDDPRLVVRRHPENLGFTRNVNAALAEARGTYLTVLGADDWIAPGFLEAAVGALADPAVGGVHAAALWMTSDGTPYALSAERWPERSSPADAFVRCFTTGFCFSALVMRRAVIAAAGAAPVHWGNIADSWLFLRSALAGDIAFLPEPLVRYRVHQESISLGMYGDGSLFRDHIRVAREAFGWPEARALGLDAREGEALAGIVRNAMRIAHLSRLAMSPREFLSLVAELAAASPRGMLSPQSLARLGFCALPRPVIRSARAARLRRGMARTGAGGPVASGGSVSPAPMRRDPVPRGPGA